MSKSAETFPFQLEGEFAGFVPNAGKSVKFMRLAIADREFPIKLSRELRPVLATEMLPGDRVRVIGQKKLKGKFKADRVERLSCSLKNCAAASKCAAEAGKILLCQKSGCRKRGGDKLQVALEQALAELGLQDSVRIERTGCQKRCKKAPNFVLMPGKFKYGAFPPQGVADLLEQHYSQ